jgi:hypothetical protein
MKKIILILFTFLLVTSCIDNRESWLQEYQNTKCAWNTVDIKYKSDSIKQLENLSVNLISLKKEIHKISKPIENKIAILDSRIGKSTIKYLDESRKVSEAHEMIYGHNSTPEFEKKQDQITKKSDIEIAVLKNEITILKSKLNKDETYNKLVAKKNKINTQVAKIAAILKEKHKTIFDSLQKELDNQNYDYNYILQKLNKTEKIEFSKAKERIKLNPCK